MLPVQAVVAGAAAGKYHLETMETIDRAEEWRRLKELYLEKSDEELEVVAHEAYELTDVAQQALEAEIARRGLKLEMRKAPEAAPGVEGNFIPDPTELNLVSVQQVFDREEAKQAKDALSNNGLPSFLGPENVESVEDFRGSFERGVDIKVREVDSGRAHAALRNIPPREPVDENVEYIARCPKCHSDEIVFLSLDESATESRDAQFNWSCDACGYKWKDDGIEQ
jgi:DNA-directed RNA polymerase subunit M/transcription elongation factor TFIIS